MPSTPIRVLVPLALSLAAPFALSAAAQDAPERSRSNQVQDAGGARGGQTPEQRKAAQEEAARERAAQQRAEQEKAAKRKEQQAREAAEKERQAGRQPEARPPQRRQPDPATDQEKLEQRKQNARQQQQQQQQDEQEKLEQRKKNARAQQQQEQKGEGAPSRGAPPAAQRAAVNQWATEMRLHRDRVARIERLKEIATGDEQRERVTELDQLLARETKRHEGKLARIEAAIDPAVLRQLQARLAKAGGADPKRREAPPAKDPREAPTDGARKAPAEGARKDAAGGAVKDAAGTKDGQRSSSPR